MFEVSHPKTEKINRKEGKIGVRKTHCDVTVQLHMTHTGEQLDNALNLNECVCAQEVGRSKNEETGKRRKVRREIRRKRSLRH